MTALNLTANDAMQKIFLEHFTPLVSDTLADKINNGVIIEKDGKRLISKKDLNTFMGYLAQQSIDNKTAIKLPNGMQAVGMEGEDVLSCAIHYFEEESIEGKLYNEDGTEYVPPKPVYKPSTPTIPYTPPKPKPEPQLSMFDLLGEQKKDEPAPIEITDRTDDHEPVEEADEEPTEEEIAEAMEQEIQTPIPPITKQPSPLYQHYLNIQNKYSDAIVALRIGDFYEVLGANAVKIANELDLTLTGRDCGLEERVPMIGFPYHTADSYIDKLIGRGYKIAIADDITTNNVTVKEPELYVDEDTGEVLSVKEMRKFDGDTEETDLPTVTKIISGFKGQAVNLGEKAKDIKQAGQIMQKFEETPDDDDDFPPIDTTAYDPEALSILDELFGNTIILR